MGRGVTSPRGRGLERGLCPSAENFWIFGVRMACSGAFLALF